MSPKADQSMKAETAAKKLGVYLPATPEDFRTGEVTRSELNELLANPPEWLEELRKNGPHPRTVVAGKLGVSVSGLVRAEQDKPFTSDEIQELLKDQPAWLAAERKTQAAVREAQAEDKNRKAAKAAKAAKAPNGGR